MKIETPESLRGLEEARLHPAVERPDRRHSAVGVEFLEVCAQRLNVDSVGCLEEPVDQLQAIVTFVTLALVMVPEPLPTVHVCPLGSLNTVTL